MKIRSWTMLVISGFLLNFSLSAYATPQFQQPVLDVGAEGGVSAVFLADLDKDGIPDLITQSTAGSGLFADINVLLGGVNGTFGSPVTVATCDPSAHVAVADINGDGNSDILIVDDVREFGYAGLTVLLGRGSNGFVAAATDTSLNVPFGAAAFGDLNGDGKLDFVIADPGTGLLYVFLGNGDGTFAPASTDNYGGAVLSTFVLVDVNHDGKLDVVGTDGSNLIVMFGNGDGTFSTPTVYSGLNGAQAIAVGDINGDKSPDVVTTGINQYNVLVNNGDGTFQPTVSTAFSGTDLYRGTLALADLDGDGYPELLLLDGSGNALNVAKNQHDGTFAAAQTYIVGSNPSAILVASLKNDKRPDVLVGATDVVSLLLNKGDGTFPALSSQTGSRATDVIAVDVNNDGQPDIVSTNGDDTFKVQIASGNGAFRAAQSYPVGLLPQEIVAADVNGDGRQDLLVQAGNSQVQVWLNTGGGTFSLKSSFTFPSSSTKAPIAVADMNGDSRPDVVVGSVDKIYIFDGNGQGSFSQSKMLEVGAFVSGIALADLNGDGHTDIVVNTTTGIFVYLGNGSGGFQLSKKNYPFSVPAIAVADIDGDGIPDIVCGMPGSFMLKGVGDGTFTQFTETTDEESFSGYEGPVSVAVADINGDGIPDVVTVDQAGVVGVFIQNSDHSFTLETGYQTGASPSAIAVADVSGDGRADLIVSTALFNNAIEVLEQTDEHAPILTVPTLKLSGSPEVNGKLSGSDVDGDAIYYAIVNPPSNGTASVDPVTGEITYVGGTNSNGASDSFTVIAGDGYLNSKVATVNVVGNGGSSGSASGNSSGGGAFDVLALFGLLFMAFFNECRRLRV